MWRSVMEPVWQTRIKYNTVTVLNYLTGKFCGLIISHRLLYYVLSNDKMPEDEELFKS